MASDLHLLWHHEDGYHPQGEPSHRLCQESRNFPWAPPAQPDLPLLQQQVTACSVCEGAVPKPMVGSIPLLPVAAAPQSQLCLPSLHSHPRGSELHICARFTGREIFLQRWCSSPSFRMNHCWFKHTAKIYAVIDVGNSCGSGVSEQ